MGLWELLELGPVCRILHEDDLSCTSYLTARKKTVFSCVLSGSHYEIYEIVVEWNYSDAMIMPFD